MKALMKTFGSSRKSKNKRLALLNKAKEQESTFANKKELSSWRYVAIIYFNLSASLSKRAGSLP